MTDAPAMILPGSWADWARQVADVKELKESAAVIHIADEFADSAGTSLETGMAMLLWLGSLAMHNFSYVQWPSGLWHPSGLVISTVEQDGVAIDSITNGFIKMVRELGLDPIQDTVKEGPSGLIARLEQSRSKVRFADAPTPEEVANDISALARLDTTHIDPAEANNIGNVRGLIYPSARSFLSYLYDIPFFNALDELIQHGSLNVRGKVDSHVLRNLNLAVFLPFYQGALANMLGSPTVQSNYNVLMRQVLTFWPMESRITRAQGNVARGLQRVQERATVGLKALVALMPPSLSARTYTKTRDPLFNPGVGTRYATINRSERLTRLSVGIAFWRIAAGSSNFELTDSDYAVADMVLHAHETGSRLVEICSSKGTLGREVLKFLVSAAADSKKTATAEGLAQTADNKMMQQVLETLASYQIIGEDHKIHESYRIVDGDTITAHRERWGF